MFPSEELNNAVSAAISNVNSTYKQLGHTHTIEDDVSQALVSAVQGWVSHIETALATAQATRADLVTSAQTLHAILGTSAPTVQPGNPVLPDIQAWKSTVHDLEITISTRSTEYTQARTQWVAAVQALGEDQATTVTCPEDCRVPGGLAPAALKAVRDGVAAATKRLKAAQAAAADKAGTLRACMKATGATMPADAPEIVLLAMDSGRTAPLPVLPADVAALDEAVAAAKADEEARQARIRTLGEDITALWSRLGTHIEEQREFIEASTGYSDATIAAVQSKLHELQVEFKARLAELEMDAEAVLEEARGEARWTAEDVETALERVEVPSSATVGGVDASRLTRLEACIEQARARAEAIEPVAKLWDRLLDLQQAENKLAEIQADPNRLLSRARGTARLEEERLEKRVKREMPVIKKKFIAAVQAWPMDDEPEGVLYLDGQDASAVAQELEAALPERQSLAKRTSIAHSVPSSARSSMQPAAAAAGTKRPAAEAPKRTARTSRARAPPAPAAQDAQNRPAAPVAPGAKVRVSDRAVASASRTLAAVNRQA